MKLEDIEGTDFETFLKGIELLVTQGSGKSGQPNHPKAVT
jgi:hypothetical protein